MHEDRNDDFAPSLASKLMMWMMLRKMIRTTKRSIRHAKLTIQLYRRLAQRAGSTGLESAKQDKASVDMKASQVEAALLQEQRSLEILETMDLNDSALYKPLEE